MNRRARVVSSPAVVTPVSAVAGVARQYCGTLGKVANCQLGVFLPMPRPAATLVGGALLHWGIVQAGQASARDRDGQLEAMKPTFRAPSWDPSRRR